MQITLKEVEVNKLSLSEGDALIAKLQGNEFDHDTMQNFGTMLKKAFPNNRVIVLNIPDNHGIAFEIAKNEPGCDNDLEYCSNCVCGKKE